MDLAGADLGGIILLRSESLLSNPKLLDNSFVIFVVALLRLANSSTKKVHVVDPIDLIEAPRRESWHSLLIKKCYKTIPIYKKCYLKFFSNVDSFPILMKEPSSEENNVNNPLLFLFFMPDRIKLEIMSVKEFLTFSSSAFSG